MTGMIGDSEFEAKMAKLELGRTKDPKEQKALREKMATQSMLAVEELASEFATEQQLGSIKDTAATRWMDPTKYFTAVGAGAGAIGTSVLLAGGPAGWAALIGVGIGGAVGYLISGFVDLVNNYSIPITKKKEALLKLMAHAKSLLHSPDADQKTRNGAKRLIEVIKLAIESLPTIKQINEAKNLKANTEVVKRQEDAAASQGVMKGIQNYGKKLRINTHSANVNVGDPLLNTRKILKNSELSEGVGSVAPNVIDQSVTNNVVNSGSSISNISGSSSPSASQYMTYPLQIA